eukprot:scaffold2133_cov259-Pinguiococcus_pyrenoidosus.AAC.1
MMRAFSFAAPESIAGANAAATSARSPLICSCFSRSSSARSLRRLSSFSSSASAALPPAPPPASSSTDAAMSPEWKLCGGSINPNCLSASHSFLGAKSASVSRDLESKELSKRMLNSSAFGGKLGRSAMPHPSGDKSARFTSTRTMLGSRSAPGDACSEWRCIAK